MWKTAQPLSPLIQSQSQNLSPKSLLTFCSNSSSTSETIWVMLLIMINYHINLAQPHEPQSFQANRLGTTSKGVNVIVVMMIFKQPSFLIQIWEIKCLDLSWQRIATQAQIKSIQQKKQIPQIFAVPRRWFWLLSHNSSVPPPLCQSILCNVVSIQGILIPFIFMTVQYLKQIATFWN